MATLKSGRKVSIKREASRSLRNALTRADAHTDAAKREACLRAGTATALAWLDGTHPKLAQPA